MHNAALSAAANVRGAVNVASACEIGKEKGLKDAGKELLAALSSQQYLACQGMAVMVMIMQIAI